MSIITTITTSATNLLAVVDTAASALNHVAGTCDELAATGHNKAKGYRITSQLEDKVEHVKAMAKLNATVKELGGVSDETKRALEEAEAASEALAATAVLEQSKSGIDFSSMT